MVVFVAGAVVSADGPADVPRSAATPPESPPSLLTVQTGRTLLYAAAFTPDGALVATAGDDVVQLWSTATGEPVGAAIPVGAAVGDVAFSPDGALLAASGGDGAVRLWNVADRRREDVKVARAAGALAFSPDGRRLAVVTDSGVGLLDVPTRTTEGFLDGSKSYSPQRRVRPDRPSARRVRHRWWPAAVGRDLPARGRRVHPLRRR